MYLILIAWMKEYFLLDPVRLKANGNNNYAKPQVVILDEVKDLLAKTEADSSLSLRMTILETAM